MLGIETAAPFCETAIDATIDAISSESFMFFALLLRGEGLFLGGLV